MFGFFVAIVSPEKSQTFIHFWFDIRLANQIYSRKHWMYGNVNKIVAKFNDIYFNAVIFNGYK